MISLDHLRFNKSAPPSKPPQGKVDLKVDPSTGVLAQMNSDGTFTDFGSGGGGGTVDPSASFVAVAASRDLAESDNGKVLICDSAGTIVLTPLASLPAGFNCGIVQKGAGPVSIQVPTDGTLNGLGGENFNTTTAYQSGTLLHLPDAGDFLVAGDFGPSA